MGDASAKSGFVLGLDWTKSLVLREAWRNRIPVSKEIPVQITWQKRHSRRWEV